MKASFFPPLPSLLLSSPGESLDLFGRTTTALMASLPPWRRRFGCSACGGRLLVVVAGSLWRVSASAPAFAFIVIILWVALVVVWRMLCRPVLVDALPPSSFRADVLPLWWVGWMLCHPGVTDHYTLGVVILYCRFQLRSCIGLRDCLCRPRFSYCTCF